MTMSPPSSRPPRKPPWLKANLGGGDSFGAIKRVLREGGLHTVCEEARCPNRGECWNSKTSTFLILGDTCTRSCRFCSVRSGKPGGVIDATEPERVALATERWGLRYVVLTSVDRDDLPDGGAAHFALTIQAIRARSPSCLVEVLVPDFSGRVCDIETVIQAGPQVFAHNIEVPRRISALARDPRASYDRSLEVLRLARGLRPQGLTKSSIMLGLGETESDILASLQDLRDCEVSVVTLGQYLQPTPANLPVQEYVSPEQFERLAERGRALGIPQVFAGPLVRSSYRAAELFAERQPLAAPPTQEDPT